MRDVSIIEINLSDIDHNMRILRQIVGPDCSLCPIVKADAYGLGAVRIAKRLASNGAELVAVYTPDQAAELFRAAIGCRVLVLMPLRDIARVDELYRGLIADRLQLTVHDMDHVSDLIAITERYGVTMNVHLEIDTGMSRGGCSVAEAPAILKRIAGCRRLNLAGIFTHFASAESDVRFTNHQLAVFDQLLAEQSHQIPKDCRVHVASSFAMLRHPRYHRAMVRIGLAWAGYGMEWMASAADDEIHPTARQLRPSVTWRSRIVQIKPIAAGTPVGYGSSWVAPRPSVIGLVPVGYADGYPITAGARNAQQSGGGAASVAVMSDHGDLAHGGGSVIGYAPVIGTVNMDQITIDLTDIHSKVRIGAGSHIELISPDPSAPTHLPTLARLAGTIPHEMLCRLNPRLKRVYVVPVAAVNESTPAKALAG
jgi:alanine racemase